MRSYEWWPQRLGPGAADATRTDYQLVQLSPGDTFIRALLWMKCTVVKPSVGDPCWGFGPNNAMGISVSNDIDAPELDPLVDWTHTGTPEWLWQYWPTAGPYTSPPEAEGGLVADMLGGRPFFDVKGQHKNVSGADEYVYLSWSLDPEIYDGSLMTWSIACKVLTLLAPEP
jgi:hypothetical protein